MTVLVDTSVWVDHLRRGNEALVRLLDEGLVACHEHVIGELACGGLRNRHGVLSLLLDLPRAPEASFEEVLSLIEGHSLHGEGLGWIDMHLLASARLAPTPLWTLDRKLAAAASEVGCGWDAAGTPRT